MSEKSEIQAMLDELKAMKESMAAATTQPQQTTQTQAGGILAGWQNQQTQIPSGLNVEKVLVPVEISTQKGNVTVYFQLSGDVASNPTTLINTIVGMQNANIPVKAWMPKGGSNNWKQ